MQVWSSLPEEVGDLSGFSPTSSSVALCCAIIEDAQTAREFDMEPHGAMEMLRSVMFAPTLPRTHTAPLPRELTSLIF